MDAESNTLIFTIFEMMWLDIFDLFKHLVAHKQKKSVLDWRKNFFSIQ